MKKIYKKIKIIIIADFLFVFLFALGCFAAPPTLKSTLDEVGDQAGYQIKGVDETSMSEVIGSLINVVLSLIGVIFVVLMIYAGYNWMTAAGEEEKIDKAKSTIWRAIIGIIIVVGSYAIWNFVFDNFVNAK